MRSDILTLNKIKKGDIKAFESLFKHYYTPLCSYAMSITGRMDVAEDIVQELFYVFWKERENIRLFHSLKSYLYGSVRNRAFLYLDHQEVRNRHREVILSQPTSEPDSPQELFEYNELNQFVDQTINSFPERRKRIFHMHRIQGMKYAEIASELSLSVKTVEAEMSKALQTLRAEVNNYRT